MFQQRFGDYRSVTHISEYYEKLLRLLIKLGVQNKVKFTINI